MATKDELLKPRYQVVANYPESKNKIGDIIVIENAGTPDAEKLVCRWYDQFPAIFVRLGWWEERKVEDMPLYVKCINGWIHKVEFHRNGGCDAENDWWLPYDNITPATREEYEQSKNVTPKPAG